MPRRRTPEWMKRRLERSGIRAISALVDVTNYVMLELGQPLHAFDNTKLEGAVHARMAKPEEKLLLLNEQTIAVDADVLVIADDAKPLAMAGIMGGEESGITLETTNCSSSPPSLRRRPSPAVPVATASAPMPRTVSSAASISAAPSVPSSAPRS
jgi:phenylalanyl-tRNA synthetase beta subunit